MITKNYFLILSCIALYVVVAEHQKRDVHKIILQHTIPRNHKRNHAHNHGRKPVHKYKNGKRGSDESYSNSFEDSGSYSKESSFENFHNRKTRKPNQKSPIFHRHQLDANLDVQESRHRLHKKEIPSFYDEWLPIKSDHLTSNFRKEKGRSKRKLKRPNYRNTHKDFDDFITRIKPYQTTSHNLDLPYDSSTLYPPLDVLSTFSALNKKNLWRNNDDDDGKLKDHKIKFDDGDSGDRDLGGYIVMPDNTSSELNSQENAHIKFNTRNKRPIRFNGRI